MKTKLLFICFLFLTINCEYSYSQAKFFTYPFGKNDKEWLSYANQRERVIALQIPDSIIAAIPTEELIDVCMDFPCLIDMFFSDNLDEGFNPTFSL